VRDFCDHANAACDGCHFPVLVRSWEAQRQSPASEAR
jgi:hypothetical protein